MRAWLVRTQCAAYAANSLTSQTFLATHGIPPEKIRLIPNGHDDAPFQRAFDRQALRAALGVAPDDRLAIFVGRLIDSKRVCDLIEATQRLRSNYKCLRVVIVGDGPERAALEAQTVRSGLSGVVQLLGMRNDVADLLRCADLFVFPSETEGLSNAVIEAALASLPIVGYDIGGVRDVVDSGREALLVAPCDVTALTAAMRRYLQDDDLARQHGAAARNRAEHDYAIQNTLARLYELYDQVLDRRA